jgi:hypothetical protein
VSEDFLSWEHAPGYHRPWSPRPRGRPWRRSTLRQLDGPSNVSVLVPPAPGLEASFETFARAGRNLTPYAVVAADPLGELAEEWRKIWTVGSPQSSFEQRAGEAIVAWRSGRLEMPDYYLVVLNEPVSPMKQASSEPHEYDFHLGVLRRERKVLNAYGQSRNR